MGKSRVRPPAADDVETIKYDKGGKPIGARQRHDGWTPKRREEFLKSLASTCNVTASCRAAGMSAGAIYPLRQRDAAFRAAWAAALREGYARLEAALLHRAINGVSRPIYYKDKKLQTVRHYTDANSARMLARHQAAVLAAPEAVIDKATIAEARLTIERRIRAIKLRRTRMADHADSQEA